jgi:hybrid cluster-associated redox disulfide protein
MRCPRLDDPDLPLSDLMTQWPETIAVFNRHRMLCVGCLISPFHTIVDCCREYDLDEKVFLAELMRTIGAG